MKTITSLFFAAVISAQAAFDHTHQEFTEILTANVKNEAVDYAAIKKSPTKLGTYIESLSKLSESDFKKWTEDEQLAYLINLYNAATLQLIIDNYPLKSITDLEKPWDKEFIKLFGKKVSLNHIEHEILRKDYEEPRIHFGVNCASIGCPALRAEAFRASELDAQLDEQVQGFIRDNSKNHFDAKSNTLNLSLIFEWFKDDFTKKSGTVEKFVTPYFTEADQKVIKSKKPKVKNTEYNWNLNKQ